MVKLEKTPLNFFYLFQIYPYTLKSSNNTYEFSQIPELEIFQNFGRKLRY